MSGSVRSDARRNREQVLRTAQQLFATEGLGVSLDEIARRAGVGPGTVHRHFPAKEALYLAVATDMLEQLVAEAEVLDAGERRSTIEFVTPDRVTYRPELGVLYPSELAKGMRIYVEYDKRNPNLVRVQHRNAKLAIIPAGSIAVAGWLIAAAALTGLAWVDKRLDRQLTSSSSQPGS